MMNDRAREIHGVDQGDTMSDVELVAELSAEIERIERGDFSGVAPWSTPAETLNEFRLHRAHAYGRMTDPRLAGKGLIP
jgi:hypothetical protein